LHHGLPKFRLRDYDISVGLSFPSKRFHASNNPSATNYGNPLQLLLKLRTTLRKHFVNPLPQVHQCFKAHP